MHSNSILKYHCLILIFVCTCQTLYCQLQPLRTKAQQLRIDESWKKYYQSINDLVAKVNSPADKEETLAFLQEESDKLQSAGNFIESGYIWNYAARMFIISGNFEASIDYYGKAIEILSAHKDTTYLHLMYYYQSQAIILGTNDHVKALEIVTEAARLYGQRKAPDKAILGKFHYARGWSLRGLQQFSEAITAFNKSISMTGDTDGYVESFVCRTYLDMEEFDKALQSAQTTNSKYYAAYGKQSHEYLLLIARALAGVGQLQKAEGLMRQSIKLGREEYDVYHSEYIKLFYFLAQIQLKAEKYDQALKNCDRIFELSYPDFDFTTKHGFEFVSGPSSNLWVLDGAILKGQILLAKYTLTKKVEFLQEALSYFDLAIQDVYIRRASLSSWKSKQQFNFNVFAAYEGAIKASYMLYQESAAEATLNRMLTYIESSRSILIKSYQKERRLQQDVLTEEQEKKLEKLKMHIAEIEKSLYMARDSLDLEQEAYLNKQLVDTRNEWKTMITPYLLDEKTLFDATEESSVSIDLIRKYLVDKKALFMFYELDTALLSIFINTDEVVVEGISKSTGLEQHIDDLYTSLSDWHAVQNDFETTSQEYAEASQALSAALLSPLIRSDADINQLLIIPHGKLFALPFESLIIEKESLLKRYPIHYSLSLDQILDSSITRSDSPEIFGGFAPIYADVKIDSIDRELRSSGIVLRGNFQDIPGTRNSISNLAKMLGGEAWIGPEASKQSFIDKAKDFRILHLAMHGKIHEEESHLSRLYFNNNVESGLTLREIQSLNLNSDMVVLSACETHVGTIKKGEGPLSLAYAFQYAGAKSVLSSLWSVPDIQTSQIMLDYYRNLKKGWTKSKSLQEAKLNYLSTAVGIERHPSFWAGFIILGDDQPVLHSFWAHNLVILVTILAGLFVVLVIFLFFKYKN